MTAAPKSQLTANSMAKIDPQTGLIEGTTPVEKTGDPVADRLLAKQSIGTGRGTSQHAVGVQDLSYRVNPNDPLSRYQKHGVTNLLPGVTGMRREHSGRVQVRSGLMVLPKQQ